MAGVLKLTHLVYDYRMTKVKIRRCRVKSDLDSHWLAGLQAFYQFRLQQNLFCSSTQLVQCLVDVAARHLLWMVNLQGSGILTERLQAAAAVTWQSKLLHFTLNMIFAEMWRCPRRAAGLPEIPELPAK